MTRVSHSFAPRRTRIGGVVGEQIADLVRKGQIIFHDADYCFQQWLSCASCHPGEARVDGLNWDLLNDGIGNPKNAKSLLHTYATPPTTWRGAREDFEHSVEAGLRMFQLHNATEEELAAVRAYLTALEAEPSPYLENGELSLSARRGKELFESSQVGCARCHRGDFMTNMRAYDVGTGTPLEPTSEYDTPRIVEVWRTAPYLHDGRAATLREVLTTFNPDDQHGRTSELTGQQLDDLLAYLKSL